MSASEAAPARVLIVDDEPDLALLVSQRFRKQVRDGKVHFLFANDGVEALELVASNPDIDMVVSDINMPRMDGLMLLEKLQAGDDKMSTVIVSAYGDMTNIRTAMNRGAFDFLTKPIDFSDLEATIDRTIRHVWVLRDARRRLSNAEKARVTLSRYFSPRLAESLMADRPDADLSGKRREVAAVFTDIEGFTTLAESIDPGQLAQLLDEYLEAMTDVAFRFDGTIAKIVGDALHVLFGAPVDQPDHAKRAVDCALALDTCAQAFRSRWRDRLELGVTRIGVHAGPAIVGNFGGGRFFHYTAYGDTINTAARLESVNRQLGTRICVSAAAAEQIEDFHGRPVGDLILRGRSQPLRAYEPLHADASTEPTTALYAEAFAKLEAGDTAAMPAFATLVGSRADDRLAAFHLKRLLNGQTTTLIVMD